MPIADNLSTLYKHKLSKDATRYADEGSDTRMPPYKTNAGTIKKIIYLLTTLCVNTEHIILAGIRKRIGVTLQLEVNKLAKDINTLLEEER